MSGYKIDEVIGLLYQINLRLKRIEDHMELDEQELEDILKQLDEELSESPAPKTPKLTVVKNEPDDNVFDFIPR